MNEEEAINILKKEPDYSLSYYKREKAIEVILNLVEEQKEKIIYCNDLLNRIEGRKYYKKYIKERRKKEPDLLYPDFDEIYEIYYKQKEEIKEYKNALIDMVNQFADTDKQEKRLSTMGLSALENAFSVLEIDEGIKREDLWKLQEGDK